jgi:hypothetical protein
LLKRRKNLAALYISKLGQVGTAAALSSTKGNTRSNLKADKFSVFSSVVDPEPQGAGTFGWSRNIEVSAQAPGQLE